MARARRIASKRGGRHIAQDLGWMRRDVKKKVKEVIRRRGEKKGGLSGQDTTEQEGNMEQHASKQRRRKRSPSGESTVQGIGRRTRKKGQMMESPKRAERQKW